MAEEQAKDKEILSTHTYADGEKAPEKWYQGRSGKVSAKRVAGLVLVIGGLVVARSQLRESRGHSMAGSFCRNPSAGIWSS